MAEEDASDERMWSALLAQANANHATASALLQLVQRCAAETPVCSLEPDHLESWFAASQDAHDLSQGARGLLHTVVADGLHVQVGGAASAAALPQEPLVCGASVEAPPQVPSSWRELLELNAVDVRVAPVTPLPRSRATSQETPCKAALPSACADVVQRGPHTGDTLSVESVTGCAVTDATAEAQAGHCWSVRERPPLRRCRMVLFLRPSRSKNCHAHLRSPRLGPMRARGDSEGGACMSWLSEFPTLEAQGGPRGIGCCL